jgi:hypothetical protein
MVDFEGQVYGIKRSIERGVSYYDQEGEKIKVTDDDEIRQLARMVKMAEKQNE